MVYRVGWFLSLYLCFDGGEVNKSASKETNIIFWVKWSVGAWVTPEVTLSFTWCGAGAPYQPVTTLNRYHSQAWQQTFQRSWSQLEPAASEQTIEMSPPVSTKWFLWVVYPGLVFRHRFTGSGCSIVFTSTSTYSVQLHKHQTLGTGQLCSLNK